MNDVISTTVKNLIVGYRKLKKIGITDDLAMIANSERQLEENMRIQNIILKKRE